MTGCLLFLQLLGERPMLSERCLSSPVLVFVCDVEQRAPPIFGRAAITLGIGARPSSVTFVRPTQAVQIFDNISTALGTLAIH